MLATGLQPHSLILTVAALAVVLKFGTKIDGAWLGTLDGVIVTVGECDAEGAGLEVGIVEGFDETVGDSVGATGWPSGMHAF